MRFLSVIAMLAVSAPTLAAPPAEGAVKSAPSARKSRRAATTKKKRSRKQRTYTGWVARQLRGKPLERPSGLLEVESIHTGETLRVNIYGADGEIDPVAAGHLKQLFRCRRSGHETELDPRLLEVLSHVYDKYGRRIILVSGHRTNTTGFHGRGAAADIRVPGVPIKKLRRFVERLDTGGMGVGLYPKSQFIHVDVRPRPSYRWIDREPGKRRRSAEREKPVS